MSAAEERMIESLPVEQTLVQAISKAELDQQIATARAYPRSLKKFIDECRQMATLNEQIAGECIYALPRDGKTIEGPSARLAEIVVSAWGNCRAGARVVDEGREFITAQGVFHDLEKNSAITYEVKRRITNRRGDRFSADMIAVTGNAACSIALRNAVFKGVPKAFWSSIYEDARRVIAGDSKTLANRRADALGYLQKLGATQDMVLKTLGVTGVEDITLEHLTTLRGVANAIKEGEITVEEAFTPKVAPDATTPATGSRTQQAKEALKKGGNGKSEKKAEATEPAHFSEADAIKAIKESGSVEDLAKAWAAIALDYDQSGREVEPSVDEAYKQQKTLLSSKL
jgi:hypothetical protein